MAFLAGDMGIFREYSGYAQYICSRSDVRSSRADEAFCIGSNPSSESYPGLFVLYMLHLLPQIMH